MQRSLRKYLWVLHVVLILFIGLFLALGVNSIITSSIVSAMPSVTPPPPEIKEDDGNDMMDGMGLMPENRNLFNQEPVEDDYAEDEPTEDETTEDEPVVEAPPPAPGEPQPTDLRVVLFGTRVASDPRYSEALFTDLDSQKSMSKRPGQTFMEDATVIKIERDIVYFRRHSKANQIEYIELYTEASEIMARAKKAEAEDKKDNAAGRGGAATPNTPSTPVKNTGGASAKSGSSSSSSGTGNLDPKRITSKGRNTYEVPRDMAEQIRDNPKLLQDASRFGPPPQIQPVYKNQQISGFRVRGVTSGSIYYQLGIRNGDIIQDVNGTIVDNPQKALAFFDQLGPGSDVKLNVNRRGRPTALTYSMD